jgi:hypothetical protein
MMQMGKGLSNFRDQLWILAVKHQLLNIAKTISVRKLELKGLSS